MIRLRFVNFQTDPLTGLGSTGPQEGAHRVDDPPFLANDTPYITGGYPELKKN
jgi:hypothetical protein